MRAGSAERGQASIEAVAMLPVLVVVVAVVVHVLAAGAASEAAEAAAEAGAAAILQDGDPRAAARRALGPSAVARARIVVRGRAVSVSVRPVALTKPLADVLTARARADAGPGPAAPSSTTTIRGGDGDSARPSSDGSFVRGDGDGTHPSSDTSSGRGDSEGAPPRRAGSPPAGAHGRSSGG